MRSQTKPLTALVVILALPAFASASLALGQAAQTGRLVVMESAPMLAPAGDEIPPAERVAIRAAIDEYLRRSGSYRGSGAARSAVPSRYPFFPMAGRFGRDVFPRNFLDMAPAVGSILDFACGEHTYDGHRGHDITIRSFAEKDIGVPVYAALDGRVVRTDDGHYDENDGSTPANTSANHVVIDHGNGQIAYYWHLKDGSVAVNAGDEVVAGQQIGQVASSGFSNWPHLHFETHVNGAVVEPSSGACNPGPSGWLNQPRPATATYLSDFSFSDKGLSGVTRKTLPWEMTRTGQIELKDPVLYFWFLVKNQPANAPWRAVFRRPNGTVAHDESGTFVTPFNRGTWWYFGFDVDGMHRIPGTWELQFFLAGKSMGKLPVEVVAKRKRRFNRAPAPVKTRFEPRTPRDGQVVSCLVTTDLLLDDPDYDLVRFNYAWTVNGELVRSIESAAHSDALRRDLVRRGDVIGCSVTPSDGRLAGKTTIRSRRVR